MKTFKALLLTLLVLPFFSVSSQESNVVSYHLSTVSTSQFLGLNADSIVFKTQPMPIQFHSVNGGKTILISLGDYWLKLDTNQSDSVILSTTKPDWTDSTALWIVNSIPVNQFGSTFSIKTALKETDKYLNSANNEWLNLSDTISLDVAPGTYWQLNSTFYSSYYLTTVGNADFLSLNADTGAFETKPMEVQFHGTGMGDLVMISMGDKWFKSTEEQGLSSTQPLAFDSSALWRMEPITVPKFYKKYGNYGISYLIQNANGTKEWPILLTACMNEYLCIADSAELGIVSPEFCWLFYSTSPEFDSYRISCTANCPPGPAPFITLNDALQFELSTDTAAFTEIQGGYMHFPQHARVPALTTTKNEKRYIVPASIGNMANTSIVASKPKGNPALAFYGWGFNSGSSFQLNYHATDGRCSWPTGTLYSYVFNGSSLVCQQGSSDSSQAAVWTFQPRKELLIPNNSQVVQATAEPYPSLNGPLSLDLNYRKISDVDYFFYADSNQLIIDKKEPDSPTKHHHHSIKKKDFSPIRGASIYNSNLFLMNGDVLEYYDINQLDGDKKGLLYSSPEFPTTSATQFSAPVYNPENQIAFVLSNFGICYPVDIANNSVKSPNGGADSINISLSQLELFIVPHQGSDSTDLYFRNIDNQVEKLLYTNGSVEHLDTTLPATDSLIDILRFQTQSLTQQYIDTGQTNLTMTDVPLVRGYFSTDSLYFITLRHDSVLHASVIHLFAGHQHAFPDVFLDNYTNSPFMAITPYANDTTASIASWVVQDNNNQNIWIEGAPIIHFDDASGELSFDILGKESLGSTTTKWYTFSTPLPTHVPKQFNRRWQELTTQYDMRNSSRMSRLKNDGSDFYYWCMFNSLLNKQ